MTPEAYVKSLRDPARVAELDETVTCVAKRAKQTWRQWAAALAWDVAHERQTRFQDTPIDAFIIRVILPGLFALVMFIYAGTHENNKVLFATVFGMLAAMAFILGVVETTKVRHRDMSPAHFFEDEKTLPNLESIFADDTSAGAAESPLWREWIADFREAMIERLRRDARVVTYTEQHVATELNKYIESKARALVRDMLRNGK